MRARKRIYYECEVPIYKSVPRVTVGTDFSISTSHLCKILII